MGTAAEVGEVPLAVEADPVVADLLDDLGLERILPVIIQSFGFCPEGPADGEVLGDDLRDLRLDGLEILLGERAGVEDEDAAVPAFVDLAPGPDGLLWVLLESGALFGVRPL